MSNATLNVTSVAYNCLIGAIPSWHVIAEPFPIIMAFIIGANIQKTLLSRVAIMLFWNVLFIFDGMYEVSGIGTLFPILPILSNVQNVYNILNIVAIKIGVLMFETYVAWVLGFVVSHIIQTRRIFPEPKELVNDKSNWLFKIINILIPYIHILILMLAPITFQLTHFFAYPFDLAYGYWPIILVASILGASALATFGIFFYFYQWEGGSYDASEKKLWAGALLINWVFNYGFIALMLALYLIPMLTVYEVVCYPFIWQLSGLLGFGFLVAIFSLGIIYRKAMDIDSGSAQTTKKSKWGYLTEYFFGDRDAIVRKPNNNDSSDDEVELVTKGSDYENEQFV